MMVPGVGWLIPGHAVATEQGAPAKDAVDAVIRAADLQTVLPRLPMPPNWSFDPPAWLVWALVGVALFILLLSFKDYLPIFRGRRGGRWIDDGEAPAFDAAAASGHGIAAAELARQGRFVEAMHELLLEGLQAIRDRLQDRLADSLTSREILQAAALPALGRGALRDMIGRVEWTYFGEYPATEADYLACHESFTALRAALDEMPG